MRWSLTFDMPQKYQKVRDYLHLLEFHDMNGFRLNIAEDHRVNALLKRLEKLVSITKSLQEGNTKMAIVRAFFNSVMEDYPVTTERLSFTTTAIQDPTFESVAVKVQSINIASL